MVVVRRRGERDPDVVVGAAVKGVVGWRSRRRSRKRKRQEQGRRRRIVGIPCRLIGDLTFSQSPLRAAVIVVSCLLGGRLLYMHRRRCVYLWVCEELHDDEGALASKREEGEHKTHEGWKRSFHDLFAPRMRAIFNANTWGLKLRRERQRRGDPKERYEKCEYVTPSHPVSGHTPQQLWRCGSIISTCKRQQNTI